MADHGPHSSECAHAHEAECFCSCHGAGHGIAHMPGALKNKFHKPGGDYTISPVASPTGKTHYYVVLNGDGKSPGGASVNHIPDGDKISDKPTIRGGEVPAPIAKHAKKVEVTATSGEGAKKPAEGKKAGEELVPSPQAQQHLEAQGITPGTTVKKVGSPDDHVLLGVDGEQAKLWNNNTKSVEHAHYKALFKANGGSAPPAAKAAEKAPEKAAGAPNAPQPGKGPGPGHTYAEAHLATEGIGPGDQVEVDDHDGSHPGQHIYMGHTNGAATLHSLYDGKTHFAPVPALRQPDKPWPLAPGEEKLSSELKSAAGTAVPQAPQAPEAAAAEKVAHEAGQAGQAGENAAQGAAQAAEAAAPGLSEHVQKAISHAHAAPGTVPALVRAQAYNKLSKDEFDALPDEHKQAIAEDLQTMADGGGDSGMASSKLAAGIVNKLGLNEAEGEGGPSAPKTGLAYSAGPDAEEPGSEAHSGPSDADIGHAWGHITGQNIHPKSLVKVEGKNGPHVFEGFDEDNPTHVKVRPVGASDDKTVSVPATDVTKPEQPGWAATAKAAEVKTTPGRKAADVEAPAKKAAPAAKAAEGGVPAEYTKTPVGKLTATGETLGTHGAKVSTDTNGDKFLVKPTQAGKEMIPHAEAAVSTLSNMAGLTTPQVTKIGAGTVQPMIDAKPAFPGGFDPKKLSDADVLAIQKHHVLDWLTSQHDAHAGNWLRDKDGRLVEVDKGQALKFLGSDKLNSTYHPNKQEQPPIYNALLKAGANGDVKLNDPSTGELGNFIHKLEKMPDGTLKDLFRPYANVMAQKGLTSSADSLLDKIAKRKNSLGQAFADLHKNEGITHEGAAKASEVAAPAKAAAAHEPKPEGNFSFAQSHLDTHGIKPGDKVKAKGLSGTLTYNGLDSKLGLATVTHESGAKSHMPATNLTKVTEEAAPAAKAAEPKGSHGLTPGDVVKDDEGTSYVYHGDTANGLAKVQSLPSGALNFTLDHDEIKKAPSPPPNIAAAAKNLHDEHTAAAPAKKAGPGEKKAATLEALGEKGIQPGDVVIAKGKVHSHIVTGVSSTGQVHLQNAYTGVKWTNSHENLTKSPKPGKVAQAAAEKWKASEAGKAATAATPAEPKAAAPATTAAGHLDAEGIELNSPVKYGSSTASYTYLGLYDGKAKLRHDGNGSISYVDPHKLSKASGAAKAAAPAPAKGDIATGVQALDEAGLAHGDIVTAKGKVHSHIITGVSSTGKVQLQNAYTGAKWTADAEDLTKSAKPGKVAQAAADKWKAANGLPGGGGAAPAVTAAKAAPAKAAEPAVGPLKHTAAVQNMLDAAGIQKGDAVASTHVSGTHLYWGPVLGNKSQAYLYEPKTGQVSKVAGSSLWKPSYTAPVTQKDKQDAFKAVSAAQEADAAANKVSAATSAKLAAAGPKVEVVSHTPAYQAAQAQKVAKDAERPAMQAKKSIPADPLKTLMDPSHPYTDETLLEQVSDNKATPAQKAKLAADLRKFRDLATQTKAVLAYSNNGTPALKADAAKYKQFRDAMQHDHTADARKELEKIWPSVKTDQVRAAMLQYLYERERTHGDTAFVNGMATGPQFASDYTAARWADHNIAVPHVNETERSAIGTYTGSGYNTINKSLRNGGTGGSYSAKVPKVSAAIQRSPLPEDTLLMRGEGHDMLHILGGNENDPSTFEALAGKIADDPAFLSTSIGKKPAFGKPVVWALRAPKGTKGLYVSKKPHPLSSVGTSEREVLLDRHTRRVIHAVYMHPDPKVNKVIIEAEVVPHDWVKPADWKPSPTYDAWKNFIHGDEGV